ncbi:Hypothetical predicted protein [Prunus dulcis]|uniref:Uncharacterized protein n=1 Tax=Prunus dulcis TaxID=3755 RepID=A0A5E4F689_PRUDU|nr:Hypothetical predicted protein [Prunus dulcis]
MHISYDLVWKQASARSLDNTSYEQAALLDHDICTECRRREPRWPKLQRGVTKLYPCNQPLQDLGIPGLILKGKAPQQCFGTSKWGTCLGSQNKNIRPCLYSGRRDYPLQGIPGLPEGSTASLQGT